jgi:hypothetical protein
MLEALPFFLPNHLTGEQVKLAFIKIILHDYASSDLLT